MDFSRYRDSHRHAAHRMRAALAITLAATSAFAAPARADNPGYDRPGFGFTPAVLGAGDVTLEQGLPVWSRDTQAGITRSQYSAASLLRVGIGGPLELQLGSSPWNTLRLSGPGFRQTFHGHGDSTVALKFALPSSGSAFSWGLLGSVEFTDGAPAFRNDRKQYLLGAQFNLQANARNSLGAYLQDVRAGGSDSTLVAFSDNFTLTHALTLYAQAVLLHAPGQGHGSLAGGGLAWLVTPRVQLDAGLYHRLSGSATDWQASLGISVYFGR